MRAAYVGAVGMTLGGFCGPLLFVVLAAVAPALFWYISIVVGLCLLGVCVLAIGKVVEFFANRSRARARSRAHASADDRRSGLDLVKLDAQWEGAPMPLKPASHTVVLGFQVRSSAKAAGFDDRFALIDREGQYRYAQVIDGTFQVGKSRDQLLTSLVEFAAAILIEGKGGRFTRADRSKHGILGYGGRAREAIGYELDAKVAQQLNVPALGRLA